MSKHDGFEEFRAYEPNANEGSTLTEEERSELQEAEEIQHYEDKLGVSHQVGMLMFEMNRNLSQFEELITEIEKNLTNAMKEKRINQGE